MSQCVRTMDIMKFHVALGHLNQNTLKCTAEGMGIRLTGNMDRCVVCFEARMKRLPKGKKDTDLCRSKTTNKKEDA